MIPGRSTHCRIFAARLFTCSSGTVVPALCLQSVHRGQASSSEVWHIALRFARLARWSAWLLARPARLRANSSSGGPLPMSRDLAHPHGGGLGILSRRKLCRPRRRLTRIRDSRRDGRHALSRKRGSPNCSPRSLSRLPCRVSKKGLHMVAFRRGTGWAYGFLRDCLSLCDFRVSSGRAHPGSKGVGSADCTPERLALPSAQA